MAQILDSYLAEWKRAAQLRGKNGSERLARTREEALHRFLSLGFPTTREEEWRFTSVAAIAEQPFVLADSAGSEADEHDLVPFRMPGGSAAELVFLNGHYAPELSRCGALPDGSRVESLKSALARGDDLESYPGRIAEFDRNPFVALNTAFLDDGALVWLPEHAILAQPLHLLFVATGETDGRPMMTHPRVLVMAGASSQVSIVETYAGSPGARYFTNAVTEVVVGENAIVNHYTLQYESASAYHVGSLHVQARRSANCSAHSISAGGALVRNDVTAILDGEGAECTLDGLYVADGRRLVDNHTTIDHARPHCASREIYKGILADRARGVFNGKIIVRPDAQKTDARQTNRALLLSESAQINTKPQLEIFANDVKCTHGAAIGQLDDEARFYLRSRGLSDSAARHLLIQAFAADVLNRLPLAPVRTAVDNRLQRQLAQVLAAAA